MYSETLADKSLRVPTFYSSHNDDDAHNNKPVVPAICVATLFGAIHCIPWSFHFATLQEQWVWRISAILVVGVPISIFFWAWLTSISDNWHNTCWKLCEIFTGTIYIIMMFLYIIARIILLVLPFVALRALPPGAYVQINWVSFLPHI